MSNISLYANTTTRKKNILTRKQVADKIGVSKRTILDWERKGVLKPDHYIMNRPRYLLSDVLKVMTQKPR